MSHSTTATPLLRKAATGKYVVHFGDLPVDVLGMFRSEKHDVVISNALRSFPALDRAPVLAHELTHVSDWMVNPDLLQTSNGCLSTEIHAFHNEATVWRDVEAGHLKSPANDLEREFNMISQAIASDPTGFITRLKIVYHDQCSPN